MAYPRTLLARALVVVGLLAVVAAPVRAAGLLSSMVYTYRGDAFIISFAAKQTIQTAPCSTYFDATSVTALGGAAARCVWRDAMTMIAMLGPDATVVPGNTLTILKAAFPATLSDNLPVTVDAPQTVPQPFPIVVGPSTFAGDTGNVILDASQTNNIPGGRYTASWSVTSDDGTMQNWASIDKTGIFLVVPRANFDGAGIYMFTVTITNVFGATQATNFSVTKVPAGTPIPEITVLSPKKLVSVAESVPLNALAFVSAPFEGDIDWEWRLLSADPAPSPLPLLVYRGANVIIPAGTLDTRTYVFQVRATVASGSSGEIPQYYNATATARVVVKRSSLIATFLEGSEQTSLCRSDSTHTVVARDPDDATAGFTYAWTVTCLDVAGSVDAAVTSAVEGTTTDTVTLNISSISTSCSRHKLSVSVTTTSTKYADTPNTGANKIVECLASGATRVDVTSPQLHVIGGIVTAEFDQRLVLTAALANVGTNWTGTWVDGAGSNLNLSRVAATPLTSPSLVIRARALERGRSYKFKYQVEEPGSGLVGSGSATFLVNLGPIGGRLAVSPSSGSAISTPFVIRTYGWTSSYLPLQYQYYAARCAESEFVLGETNMLPLSPIMSTMLFSSKLPNGDANGKLTLVVVVRDRYNAMATATAEVTIIGDALMTSDGLATLEASFATALSRGDEIAAMMAISYTGTALNACNVTSDHPRMRRALIQNLSNLTMLSFGDQAAVLVEALGTRGDAGAEAAEMALAHIEGLLEDETARLEAIRESSVATFAAYTNTTKMMDTGDARTMLKAIGAATKAAINAGASAFSGARATHRLSRSLVRSLVCGESPETITTDDIRIRAERKALASSTTTTIVGPPDLVLSSDTVDSILTARDVDTCIGTEIVEHTLNPFPSANGGPNAITALGSVYEFSLSNDVGDTVPVTMGSAAYGAVSFELSIVDAAAIAAKKESLQPGQTSTFGPRCQYYDTVNDVWTSEGCKTTHKTATDSLLCECTHLSYYGSTLEDLATAGIDNPLADAPALVGGVWIVLGSFCGVFMVMAMAGLLWDRSALRRIMARTVALNETSESKGHFLLRNHRWVGFFVNNGPRDNFTRPQRAVNLWVFCTCVLVAVAIRYDGVAKYAEIQQMATDVATTFLSTFPNLPLELDTLVAGSIAAFVASVPSGITGLVFRKSRRSAKVRKAAQGRKKKVVELLEEVRTVDVYRPRMGDSDSDNDSRASEMMGAGYYSDSSDDPATVSAHKKVVQEAERKVALMPHGMSLLGYILALAMGGGALVVMFDSDNISANPFKTNSTWIKWNIGYAYALGVDFLVLDPLKTVLRGTVQLLARKFGLTSYLERRKKRKKKAKKKKAKKGQAKGNKGKAGDKRRA